MSNDDDYAPDEEAGRALFEEFQNNAAPIGRAQASMIRGSANIAASLPKLSGPATRAYSRIIQRRFLMALALLYPPETHARW